MIYINYQYDEYQRLKTEQALLAEEKKRVDDMARREAALKRQQIALEKKAAEEKARRIAAAEIEEQRRLTEEACRRDWKCWAEKHIVDATVACQRFIERSAKYDFEWTDGWLENKFTGYSRYAGNGIYTYAGDSLKLQNGFGAWQRHTYMCTYDTNIKKVIAIEVSPGRLN
ncbi:MAG: hypothetical protein Hals2KO_21290 [Halioglobus sp.]